MSDDEEKMYRRALNDNPAVSAVEDGSNSDVTVITPVPEVLVEEN